MAFVAFGAPGILEWRRVCEKILPVLRLIAFAVSIAVHYIAADAKLLAIAYVEVKAERFGSVDTLRSDGNGFRCCR